MPKIGSNRFANDLDIPDLRAYPMKQFPFTIFYFDRDERIDVPRILHMHRDIINILLDIR